MKSPDSATFRYILHSSVPEVNHYFDDMGSMPLAAADPRSYLTTQFDELSQWAASPNRPAEDADRQRVVRELETMGEGFFDKLFSPELKAAYWELVALRDRGVIKSLLITSDEPWIPWEMVKPYDQRTGKKDDFLAAGWQLSRWLSGPGLGDRLNVTAVRAVIPELDLPFTRTERDYITGLKLQGVDIGTFLRTKSDVTGAVDQGQIQVIHVAAHGNFKVENPDESPITLQGRDELYPRDLQGSRLAPLRKERPILFLNACHSAQVGFSLTGLGGWANTAVREMRVSAFIGGLWEVNDDLASQIAVSFYENLRRDMTLGEAFHAARMLIRDKNPGNSTWLAYSLYGDPNMRVTWTLRTLQKDVNPMTTPMRRQYLEIKGQYPDCILFFRLGDFYETFDEDAKIVAKVCDVVLTSRPVGANQRVPLAGVPYHSVDGYLAMLIEAGYKVALAEQVSEPGNGLVDREVRQVITKGTITEPNLLDAKRNNYLVAVTFNARGDRAGIAFCDITTSEFAATEIGGDVRGRGGAAGGRGVGPSRPQRADPGRLVRGSDRPGAADRQLGPPNFLRRGVASGRGHRGRAAQTPSQSHQFGRLRPAKSPRGRAGRGGDSGLFAGDAARGPGPAFPAPRLRNRPVYDPGRVHPAQPGTDRDHPRRQDPGQSA